MTFSIMALLFCECHILQVLFTLNVVNKLFKLSVIMLSVIMLIVIMLRLVILSVVMLNVIMQCLSSAALYKQIFE